MTAFNRSQAQYAKHSHKTLAHYGQIASTTVGVRRDSAVPSPNWPESLPPQHRTPPVLISAQV